MRSPCEVIVWEVLPSIRAALAEALVNKGISQREVSRMLGITPPAVSQYVSKKRGYNMVFSDEIQALIESLADDLMNDRVDDLLDRICLICKRVRDVDECISEVCLENRSR